MRISFALSLGLLLTPVLATSPVVKVGLKASWNSPPYLLELLETAAEESPRAYWPLIDAIASGSFTKLESPTEKQLYDEFLRVANEAGYLLSPTERDSFDLALSLHSASPRIEAHYSHYVQNLEPQMGMLYDPKCAVWTQWGSKQHCTLPEEFNDMIEGTERFPNEKKKLEIDRVLETKDEEAIPAAILYADILAPEFKAHHERLKKYAEQGYLSYRLRYRPPLKREEKPVMLSGYGVELVLKKTDYMVIDDRDVEPEGLTKEQVRERMEEDAEVQDIKPLSKAELAGLGYKAASFVMSSENPFETLLKLLQDFPKHAAAVAGTEEVDEEVVEEITKNWDFSIGPGRNVVWINGVQMEQSQVNAFALLDLLRRERKYIQGFEPLGLNASQARGLLWHEKLLEARENDEVRRYDYRDNIEGGGVLVWLNDLEKDSRYQKWSPSLHVLLRRVFPGHIHPLRRNVHSMVMPVDFTNPKDLELIHNELMVFIRRQIALRFGLVPLLKTQEAIDQAKVAYHLKEVYGLKAVTEYVAAMLEKKEYGKPSNNIFKQVISEAKLKEDRTALSLEEVLASEELGKKIEAGKHYNDRLGIHAPVPPILLNGQAVPKKDDWTEVLGNKLPRDVAIVQRKVYELATEDRMDEDIDLPSVLLEGAVTRRNPYIIPETEADVKLLNLADLKSTSEIILAGLPQIEASNAADIPADASLWVVGDFDEQDGYELLLGAAQLQREMPGLGLVLINNPEVLTEKPTLSTILFHLHQSHALTPEILEKLLNELKPAPSGEAVEMPSFESLAEGFAGFAKYEGWNLPDHLAAGKFWKEAQGLVKAAGFTPGQRGLIVNGRVVGPIAKEDKFIDEDYKLLVDFERQQRITPVVKALEDLGVIDSVKGGSLGWATVTNRVSLSTLPQNTGGILEEPDTSRLNIIGKLKLSEEHSVLTSGDFEKATIQIVASIDPASELAQKLVPLLHLVSQMNGVGLKLFLNPSKRVTELPVKRFYRHVLNLAPVFDEEGKVVEPAARFENIPEKPLLSFSMDVAPSWLVNPVDSVHDLDNLILEPHAKAGRAEVTALYQLTSILIEGHARDVTTNTPPRGVQVILGTEKNPQVADTIVMANLHYFQFRANPGMWKMDLKRGRSRDIFNLDSIGAQSYRSSQTSSDRTIPLTSFLGTTVFPRLSRKPGMEDVDVLELPAEPQDLVGQAKAAWTKFTEFVGDLTSDTEKEVEVKEAPQADINIFSVASGHLYERFLGIMMASVMRHTTHTVKFWLIENFLSPSFKNSLPALSAHYGFSYELVTYKWPHWLRAQTEKQREIWGYKILFLDVLFPLSLEKVIFVDADQIVRTDLYDLVQTDLHGAPYGFTPMGDSRKEIEGFRFWKQGYWKDFLQGKPYHISALYVVDLVRFRTIAAGDRLRQQYQLLSADPNSLANLDQDLPNHMQSQLPIHSLDKEWLWCETWCADEELATARTIDLCNNPMTKEPKLERARRQVPEWRVLDEEVGAVREGRWEEFVKEKERREREKEEGEKVKDEL